LILLSVTATGQPQTTVKVEPPSWWTGFRNPSLQLMVYGKGISGTIPVINYPGITLEKVEKTSNPDYLFLDLFLSSSVTPGDVSIGFLADGDTVARFLFPLKERKPGSANRKGFSPADVIYLLMPDRFANGDPSNDAVTGMSEKPDRRDPGGRHGGDIKGIADHIGYLQNLGITAVWSTPLLENNMKKYSYHGYAITDYYHIDSRLGSNDDYFALADQLHASGLRLIMDMVFNHCGSNHPWVSDPPDTNWFNEFPAFTRTNYRSAVATDPYASGYDFTLFRKGWFDEHLPDLNQRNPFLAKYFIQHAIWWIEAAGLDGIRLDTYPYCDKDFMAEWDQAVLTEYPSFNIVGECWVTTPGSISYWQKDSPNTDGFNSHLPAVIDFAMYDALRLGFMENEGWSTGTLRLYDILSQDFVYPDPDNLLVFIDNHDVDRYLATQGGNVRHLKMALAFLLTTRGIPQIYYGTEALMTTGEDKSDGNKRADFPGGWPSDSVNAFTGKGLTADQQELSAYMRRLLNWRKNQEVIHRGKLTHFLPVEGIYVYFRSLETKTVMVVLNNNPAEKTIDPTRYDEFLRDVTSAVDVMTGKRFNNPGHITVPAESALILELEKQ